MRVADVIGNVTLSTCHPTLCGATWLVALPLSLEELRGDDRQRSDAMVIYDEYGAGPGVRIAVAEGPEASNPFLPDLKPIDACNAAILDTIELD